MFCYHIWEYRTKVPFWKSLDWTYWQLSWNRGPDATSISPIELWNNSRSMVENIVALLHCCIIKRANFHACLYFIFIARTHFEQAFSIPKYASKNMNAAKWILFSVEIILNKKFTIRKVKGCWWRGCGSLIMSVLVFDLLNCICNHRKITMPIHYHNIGVLQIGVHFALIHILTSTFDFCRVNQSTRSPYAITFPL